MYIHMLHPLSTIHTHTLSESLHCPTLAAIWRTAKAGWLCNCVWPSTEAEKCLPPHWVRKPLLRKAGNRIEQHMQCTTIKVTLLRPSAKINKKERHKKKKIDKPLLARHTDTRTILWAATISWSMTYCWKKGTKKTDGKTSESFSIPMCTCVTVRVILSEFVNFEVRGSRPWSDEPLCYPENPGLDMSGVVTVCCFKKCSCDSFLYCLVHVVQFHMAESHVCQSRSEIKHIC